MIYERSLIYLILLNLNSERIHIQWKLKIHLNQM